MRPWTADGWSEGAFDCRLEAGWNGQAVERARKGHRRTLVEREDVYWPLHHPRLQGRKRPFAHASVSELGAAIQLQSLQFAPQRWCVGPQVGCGACFLLAFHQAHVPALHLGSLEALARMERDVYGSSIVLQAPIPARSRARGREVLKSQMKNLHLSRMTSYESLAPWFPGSSAEMASAPFSAPRS